MAHYNTFVEMVLVDPAHRHILPLLGCEAGWLQQHISLMSRPLPHPKLCCGLAFYFYFIISVMSVVVSCASSAPPPKKILAM